MKKGCLSPHPIWTLSEQKINFRSAKQCLLRAAEFLVQGPGLGLECGEDLDVSPEGLSLVVSI